MKLEKILSLIPPTLLTSLAVETKVDYFTKKLQGEVVFKLLLHCIISYKDNSLRMMQSAYESIFFRMINQKHHQGKIRFSSISERLSVIEVSYFEKLFARCVELYKQDIGADRENFIRFDSTIVALSTKLLNVGYQLKGGDAENYRQIKFTVGYGDIPEIVHFYAEQTHSSENVSLKETITEQSKNDAERIKVFDRGITARATYDLFTDEKIQFVSRISATSKHDIIRVNEATKNLLADIETLIIISDNWCQLYGDKGKKSKHLVRRIEAVRKDTNETFVFVTNIGNLTAADITELYRRRWDIEIFFKFLKQLLNFKHFISRNENGIKVVLYVTMIAAILLIAYKKENGLKGFKIPKQQFANELEFEIIKQLITLCGGNPERLNEILLSNSS
ncbi:MAG: IS4 family transposase [Panacibacter sp.]